LAGFDSVFHSLGEDFGAVEPSRDDPRWAVGPSETVRAPGMGRPASRAARVTDGSDDWTVPMSVVPPEPTAPPNPSRDLWAGDPWAAEARRAAQAARAAEPPPAQPRPVEPREARSARNGAPADPRAARNGAPAHPRHDERAVYQRPAHQRPAHHRPAHERPGVVGPGGEPAVDVPAARVPPPLPSAFAPLADDRTDLFDEPTSGRHRRPER